MTPEQKAERRNLIRQAANRLRSKMRKREKRAAEAAGRAPHVRASTGVPYSDRAARAAANLCRVCPQSTAPGCVLCPVHQAKGRERSARCRKRKKAERKCYYCQSPARPGAETCQPCADQRAAKRSPVAVRCGFCEQLGHNRRRCPDAYRLEDA